MRIIAGTARGLKLVTAAGIETRPTTDRVKEALFNSIQFDIIGARCLDAFAGSGALGIEALSRGAEFVDFVEPNKMSQKAIQSNLEKARLVDKAKLNCVDIDTFIKRRKNEVKAYDIVFLDPPYNKGFISKTINLLINSDILQKNAIIIIEHDNREKIEENYDSFEKVKQKKYGNTYITTFRR